MVDVLTQIEIARPIAIVSAYASDPDHTPDWYVNIQQIEWKTPKPLALGTQLGFEAHFLGRRLVYVYEVVELQPGKRLVMRTSDGPFPMETTYEWTRINGKLTKMTLRNRGNPTGFSKLFSPFMQMAMRKANHNDLKLLKSILEEKPA